MFLRSTLDPSLIPQFVTISVIVSAAFILYAVQFSRSRDARSLRILWNGTLLSVLAYLLVSALSVVVSIEIGEAVFELLKIALAVIYYILLTLLLFDDPGRIRHLALMMTLTGLGLSVIAVLQFFSVGFGWIPGNVTPSATMANKNLLSSLLMYTLPFSVYLLFSSRGLTRVVTSVSLLLVTYVLVIGQTRSVWLAIAVSGAVTVPVALPALRRLRGSTGNKGSLGRKALLPAAMIIAGLSLGALTLALRSGAQNAPAGGQIINTSASSMNERLILWDHSLRMYGDHPYMGCGIGNWKINIALYGADGLPSQSGAVFYQRPHNDFLWALAETGIAGFVFYVMTFAFAIRYCIRAIAHSRTASDLVLAGTILFGLLAYVVDASFSFPKERMIHQVCLMSLFAVASVIGAKRRAGLAGAPSSRPHRTEHHRSSRFSAIASIIVIALALTACLTIGYIRLNSEVHTAKAFSAMAVGDRERIISEIRAAESPLSELDPTSTPLAWYAGVAEYELNRIDSAMADFTRAAAYNPYHVHVLNNLGSCHETKGDHGTAISFYERALAILPSFDEATINLAAVYYNQRDYERAYSVISRIRGSSSDPRYEPFLEKITARLKEAGRD